jgi:hypothetical protein
MRQRRRAATPQNDCPLGGARLAPLLAMRKLTAGLVLASGSLALPALAQRQQGDAPRIVRPSMVVPTDLKHLPTIVIGQRPQVPTIVLAEPHAVGQLNLQTPKLGELAPSTRLIVDPGRVEAHTGSYGLTPGAHTLVEPGRIHLKTDANALFPETEMRIDRPFEIKLRVGGSEWQVRPFDLRRTK